MRTVGRNAAHRTVNDDEGYCGGLDEILTVTIGNHIVEAARSIHGGYSLPRALQPLQPHCSCNRPTIIGRFYYSCSLTSSIRSRRFARQAHKGTRQNSIFDPLSSRKAQLLERSMECERQQTRPVETSRGILIRGRRFPSNRRRFEKCILCSLLGLSFSLSLSLSLSCDSLGSRRDCDGLLWT